MKANYTAIFLALLPVLCSCVKLKGVLEKCGKENDYRTDNVLIGCKSKVEVQITAQIEEKNTDVEFYKIDKVFDESLKEDIRLYHPIVIKVHSQAPSLVYPLKFLKSVNNKAYEIFFHKDNTEDYQGCKVSTVQSLCGYDGVTNDQPYKKGFCCVCNKDDQNSQPYHVRGGQDCSNSEIPVGRDDSYHSSAHCLKFDHVWYRVNELKEPYINHQVDVNVFTENNDNQNTSKWTTLSDDAADLSIGTTNTYATSKDGKVSVRYLFNNAGEFRHNDPLNYEHNRLLIPEFNPYEDYSNHIPLQLQGNESDFLLVDHRYINLDGSQCDRIGVSYEAFYKQHKCHKPAQSCLGNQPMHFWLHDEERRLQGRDTQFSLGGFADLASPSLYKIESSKLVLKYRKNIQAEINIQINADTLIPLIRGVGGDIEEVYYMDSSDDELLSVSVYNPGIIVSDYDVILHSCNVSQGGETRKAVTIAPHQIEKLVFELYTERSNFVKHCTVTVLNHRAEKVAERLLEFRENQTCICLPECYCSCEVDSFVCVPLSNPPDFLANNSVILLLSFLMILLSIGVIKAGLSIVAPVTIGQCGLCVFLKNKILKSYHEKDLKSFVVIYDNEGRPIHPKTKKPVQSFPLWQLILFNLFIGFYLPFVGIHWLINKFKFGFHGINGVIHKKMPDGTVSNEFKALPSESSPELGGFDKYMHLCPASLTKIENVLTSEKYRKQKKYLTNYAGQDSVLKPPIGDITPPDSGDEQVWSPKKKTRSSNTGRKVKRLFGKQTLQVLLNTDPVYCNFKEETVYLQKSGKHFSLCGELKREGRKFKFELGKYFMQTYENINGTPRQLLNPDKILHVTQFSQILTATGVHTVISTEPQYPCLNALLPLS